MFINGTLLLSFSIMNTIAAIIFIIGTIKKTKLNIIYNRKLNKVFRNSNGNYSDYKKAKSEIEYAMNLLTRGGEDYGDSRNPKTLMVWSGLAGTFTTLAILMMASSIQIYTGECNIKNPDMDFSEVKSLVPISENMDEVEDKDIEELGYFTKYINIVEDGNDIFYMYLTKDSKGEIQAYKELKECIRIHESSNTDKATAMNVKEYISAFGGKLKIVIGDYAELYLPSNEIE